MLNQFTNLPHLVLICLVLTACAGKQGKAPVQPAKPTLAVAKLVLTPEDQTMFQQALAAMRNQSYDEASRLFEQLLQRHPGLAGAKVNLGIIEQEQGDFDAARDLYTQALSLNPSNQEALLQLALIDKQEGSFRDAESKLLQVVDINDDNARAHYNLGVLNEVFFQDYDAAIDHYERYVSLSAADDVETVKRWILLLERK